MPCVSSNLRKQRVNVSKEETPRPEPWRVLAPLGPGSARTAAALAELTALTENLPGVHATVQSITDSICEEFLNLRDAMWREGMKHGKWLIEQELAAQTQHNQEMEHLTSKYEALEVEHRELQERYAALRDPLRDITNTL